MIGWVSIFYCGDRWAVMNPPLFCSVTSMLRAFAHLEAQGFELVFEEGGARYFHKPAPTL